MSELLVEILGLLGYDTADVTGNEGDVTAAQALPVTEKPAASNPESPSCDRSDRCDRDLEQAPRVPLQRGRFAIGETYQIARVERFYAVPEHDHFALDAAGFPRAGVIAVEGEALLVADAARAFSENVIFVIGFADIPEPRSMTQSGGAKKRRHW